MNKEEYVKFIENNAEADQNVEILSNLCAVIDILIDKNICTNEEYKKKREKNVFFVLTSWL